MSDTTDFIEKARADADAEKQQLEHEISSDHSRRFFSRKGYGFKDALIETLADTMARFWITVFPFLLIGGIGTFALASWLGISVMAALGGLIVLGVMILAFANSLS